MKKQLVVVFWKFKISHSGKKKRRSENEYVTTKSPKVSLVIKIWNLNKLIEEKHKKREKQVRLD